MIKQPFVMPDLDDPNFEPKELEYMVNQLIELLHEVRMSNPPTQKWGAKRVALIGRR